MRWRKFCTFKDIKAFKSCHFKRKQSPKFAFYKQSRDILLLIKSKYFWYDSWKSKIEIEFKCSICNLNLKWGLRGMASVNTYTFVVFWMNYIYTKWWWSPEMNYGLGSVQVRLKPVGTMHIHEDVPGLRWEVRLERAWSCIGIQ